MIALLFIATLAHLTAAQSTYDCQCGFFVAEQLPGQIGAAAPVPFKTDLHENLRIAQVKNDWQVAPETCLEPTSGNNTCKFICDEWGRTAVEQGHSLCGSPATGEETGIQRCYGGLYCEALYQDGRLPEEDDLVTSIRSWYRIQQCGESSDFYDWNLGGFEYPEALCCTPQGRYESCYELCDCNKAESPLNYCECGVFTLVQFEQGNEENDALPFRMISESVGDTPFSFCDNFEADSPTEECEAMCNPAGTAYFGSYTLLDSASLQYNVDPSVTFGQLYCNTLRSRRILYQQPIDTVLRVYKRAPLCDVLPNNINWLTMFPQVAHPERLCCTEDGEHQYPCQTSITE